MINYLPNACNALVLRWPFVLGALLPATDMALLWGLPYYGVSDMFEALLAVVSIDKVPMMINELGIVSWPMTLWRPVGLAIFSVAIVITLSPL